MSDKLKYIRIQNEDGSYGEKIPFYVDGSTVEVNGQSLATKINEINSSLANKVIKEQGKGLSSNDYTNEEKQKLSNIEAGATNTIIDSTLNIEGAAADALAVKEKINIEKNALQQTIDLQANHFDAEIAQLQSLVGSPLIASTASAMTDHNKIYVYTGSESGYTNGNWYYWNDSSWTSGGVYNAVAIDIDATPTQGSNNAVRSGGVYSALHDTDTTLSQSGQAADAKVVGKLFNGFNAVQLISDHADVQSKTESGLTWSCVNGVFTINGTTTSSWFENIYNSRYSVPDWFAEGKRIFIKLNKSGSNTRYIYFRIYIYKQDSTTENIVNVYNDTVLTVPNIDDAVGIYARVFIASGNAVSGSIHPVISNAPSNLELYDNIEDTNASVSDLQSGFENTDAKDTTNLVPRLSNGDTIRNGVTFSYLNGTTTINGTATSATYFKLCGDMNSLPDGVTAGLRYFIDIAHSGGTTARVRVECKVNGVTSYIYDDDKSTPLLIPSGTTGLAIYIYVYSTGVVENERMTVSLRRALTNYALSNSVLPSNPGAMLTIIDDDGALGFYTQLLPIIRTKHIPIASAIIGSKIGVNPAYMTWEQVEECFAEGAEILNHTYMHYGETDETRPTNEIRMDYIRNANLMQVHNIPNGDILVYPGGSGNMTTAQVAAKRFATAAFRSNGNKLNLINQIQPFYIDRYRIESDYSYDLNQMKGLIDNCIAKGGWMVWMIHTSSGYNWNENALSVVSQAIDYAISSGLPIVTARYGIERYIKKRLY